MSGSNCPTSPSCAPAGCRETIASFGLQHYLHNHALLKSLSAWLKIVTTPTCSIIFYQMNEEQYRPDLAPSITTSHDQNGGWGAAGME